MFVHKVPGYLETEDVFIWTLTMRQCVILGAGATIAYTTFFNIFTEGPSATFGLVAGLVAALLIGACAACCAFINVFGRGLEQWVVILLVYLMQPRVYLWRFSPPDDGPEQAQIKQRRGKKHEEGETW